MRDERALTNHDQPPGANTAAPGPAEASTATPAEELVRIEKVHQPVDGQVQFRNGEFTLTPPVGAGLPPVLIPDESVVLTVDGHVVTMPVSLLAGMKAEVRPRDAAGPVREYRVEVAPDRMSAYLSLAALGPPGYRVRDAGPGHTISLVAEPLPGLQSNPAMEDVVEALRAAGVVYGIQEQAIRQALAEPGATKVQVAWGRKPTPGSPGRVESYADRLRGSAPDRPWTEVQPGQVLARLVPPTPGEPGCDVTGQVLAPPPVQPVKLLAGRGTQPSGDGREVLAAAPGRPVVVEIAPGVFRAAVVPVMKLVGPLGGSEKPYHFEGDVVVEGDVASGVTLRAGGCIWVRGSVCGATLEAAQGIWVDDFVKWGRLVTRTTRAQLRQFQLHMQAVLDELEQMCEYLRHIVEHPLYPELRKTRSFGEVVLLLAEQHFPRLPHRLHIVRQVLASLTVRPETASPEAVLNALEHSLYSGALQSVHELAQFIDALTATSHRIIDALGAGGEDAPVHVSVLIGSEVDAEGDVVVHGSGAEQTIIQSSRGVKVNCLRDSRVQAHDEITAETVTASAGNAQLLEVAVGGRIRIDAVLVPTQVRIGGWNRTLAPRTRNVEVRSDASGQVQVVQTSAVRRRSPFARPQSS